MRELLAKLKPTGRRARGAIGSPFLERVGWWLSLLGAALVIGLGFDFDGSRRTALVAQLERSLNLELAEARQDFERRLDQSLPLELGPTYALEVFDGFAGPTRSTAATFPALRAVERDYRRSGDGDRTLRELDLLASGEASPAFTAEIELARLRVARDRWAQQRGQLATDADADGRAMVDEAFAEQADRTWDAARLLIDDVELAVPAGEPVPWILAAGLFVMECLEPVDAERLEAVALALAEAWLMERAQPAGAAEFVLDARSGELRLEFDALYEELSERLLAPTSTPGPRQRLDAHRQLLCSRAIAPTLERGEPTLATRDREWWWLSNEHLALLTFERRQLTLVPAADLAERLGLPQPWTTSGGRGVRLMSREDALGVERVHPLPLPEEVLGGRWTLSLEHPAPNQLVKAALAPWRVQRTTSVVLAGLLALTGWAGARALRRARELAEARSLLVAGVSHELRTPVASILVLADNLNNAVARKSPRAERYPELIRQEALRLKMLVDDLLDFSRLERAKPIELALEDVDLSRLCDQFTVEFEILARSRGFDYSEHRVLREDPDLRADPESLRRALLNLVKNAALHSGGSLIEFTVRELPEGIGLGVRDDGRGIPAGEWERLIQPFERGGGQAAGRTTSGTGLGLAIAYGLAQAHGGELLLRDAPSGEGAWFEIVLPVRPLESSAPQSAPTPPAPIAP
ncbi:MAG: sensor histidine kinase [Planctomycetota bacterium]